MVSLCSSRRSCATVRALLLCHHGLEWLRRRAKPGARGSREGGPTRAPHAFRASSSRSSVELPRPEQPSCRISFGHTKTNHQALAAVMTVDVSMGESTTGSDKGKARESGLASLGLDALPWVEKYRPVTMDDVVSHKDILTTSKQPRACRARHGRWGWAVAGPSLGRWADVVVVVGCS